MDAVYGSSGGVLLAVAILLAIVVSVSAGAACRDRVTATRARLQSRVLDIGGVLGLVLMPMWWIGPAAYAYFS